MLTLPTILKKSNEETNLRIYTKDCNSTSNQRFDTSLALYAIGWSLESYMPRKYLNATVQIRF